MPNEEMIRIVVKRIERDVSLWDQADWASLFIKDDERDIYAEELLPRVEMPYEDAMYGLNDFTEVSCGTAMCLAGHTVLEAGDTILFEPNENIAWACLDDNGRQRRIRLRAQQLLDLTDEQASILFDGRAGGGAIDDFKVLITKVTGVTFE